MMDLPPNTPKARGVWTSRLTEALESEMPRVYEDPGRAIRLYLRLASADTLRERQIVASEIERLQPVGFRLPPETKTEEEAEMGNWRDAIPSQWLKAADLGGRPMLVTVKRFSVEKIGDDERPVVWFKEESKGLGLNITNGNSIEAITGSPDPDDWTGAHLVLYPTETDFKGSRVECIRIRAPKKGAKLPQPEPEEFTADDDSVPF